MSGIVNNILGAAFTNIYLNFFLAAKVVDIDDS
jgi:hypothetical protein